MSSINKFDAKLANYICSSTAIVILSIRLILTRHRDKKFDLASILTATSLLVLVVRLVVVYYYLLYGTSQDYLNATNRAKFSATDLEEIRIGSILALVSRVLITSFYWLQICLLLLFYSVMVRDFHWRNTIKVCWGLIISTYVVVVVMTFSECMCCLYHKIASLIQSTGRPFYLYWQVDPSPGKCVKAYVQLVTQGTCNIILDLILLAISWPLVTVKNRTISQQLRIGVLFVIGFFCIITTCLRIAYIYSEDSYQPVRSFWASIQMLVSTFVANMPTIYGCLQLVRRRKSDQRQRRASRPEPWSPLESPVVSRPPPPVPDLAPVVFKTPSSDRDATAWARHIP